MEEHRLPYLCLTIGQEFTSITISLQNQKMTILSEILTNPPLISCYVLELT